MWNAEKHRFATSMPTLADPVELYSLWISEGCGTIYVKAESLNEQPKTKYHSVRNAARRGCVSSMRRKPAQSPVLDARLRISMFR